MNEVESRARLGYPSLSLRMLAYHLPSSIAHWLGIYAIWTYKLSCVFFLASAGLSVYSLTRMLGLRHRQSLSAYHALITLFSGTLTLNSAVTVERVKV